jgi:hypothetical protein
LAQHLKTFLFTDGPITEIEQVEIQGTEDGGADSAPGGPSSDGSLGIGSLRPGAPK